MEKKQHVLLVDDEPDFKEPVSFWLQSKGYRVSTAGNGQEALELIKRDVPDIVFLDINMPVMDGLTTLDQIRKQHKELPVILVTAAYQDEKNFAKAATLSVSGYFPKSNSLPELSQMIETVLRAHLRIKPKKE